MSRRLTDPLLWGVLLLGLLVMLMPDLSPLFAAAFPSIAPPVFDGESFATLLAWHAAIVAGATGVSGLIAVAAGIFVTRPVGREFRSALDAMATIGQTCPPVAVLAIAVPAIGYGALPTFLALVILAFLPIVANTIAGLESVPPAVQEAASGMGLTPWQILRDVELPLAAPVILAGLRTATTINIGTATIGSTVGALTLGTPIIDGLVGHKLPYVLQGAVVVGLFAIVTDLAFERLDRVLRTRAQRADRTRVDGG